MRPTLVATILSLGAIVSGVAVPDKGHGGGDDDRKCRPDKPERCTTRAVSAVDPAITPVSSIDNDDHGGDRSRTRDDDDSSTISSFASLSPNATVSWNATITGLPTVTVTVFQCNNTLTSSGSLLETPSASLSEASSLAPIATSSIDDNGGDN